MEKTDDPGTLRRSGSDSDDSYHDANDTFVDGDLGTGSRILMTNPSTLNYYIRPHQNERQQEVGCLSCAHLRQELESAKKMAAESAKKMAPAVETEVAKLTATATMRSHSSTVSASMFGGQLEQKHNAEATTINVWSDGAEYAFTEIHNTVKEGGTWMIGLDTEFCPSDEAGPPWTNPADPDECYYQMRSKVDNGDLVQVGLVIANDNFSPLSNKMYQFNLLFDATSRDPASKGVAFLRCAGLDLDAHASHGIPLAQFFVLLSESGLLRNEKLTWVTYQGFADFGYLIRGLGAVPVLLHDRIGFLTSVRQLFPCIYDLKSFHRLGFCCQKSEYGNNSLESMASRLGAIRTNGAAHHAGSDALLTLQCFRRMVSCEPMFEPIIRLKGILYGVVSAESVPRDPVACDTDVDVVDVWAWNFKKHSEVITNLFPLYGFVSAEVNFNVALRLETYATACADVAHAGGANVLIAISDARGWLAHGKIWVFHVSNGPAANGVSPAMLAELLTSAGAVLNPAVPWVSSGSGTFLYLVNLLTTAALPKKRSAFVTLCKSFFPVFYIVKPEADAGADPQLGPFKGGLTALRQFLVRYKAHPMEWCSIPDLA